MFSLLYEYLVEQRSIRLPGAGSLQLVRQSAVYDVANQQLEPPHTIITFTADNRNNNSDDKLAAFLAGRLDVPTAQAQAIFNAFCSRLVSETREQGKMHWPSVGDFSKTENGKIDFVPRLATGINQPVPANRVIRHGKTHAMMVGDTETTSTQMQEYLQEQAAWRPKDRWWIPALVIGVTALVLILLKKMQYL